MTNQLSEYRESRNRCLSEGQETTNICIYIWLKEMTNIQDLKTDFNEELKISKRI